MDPINSFLKFAKELFPDVIYLIIIFLITYKFVILRFAKLKKEKINNFNNHYRRPEDKVVFDLISNNRKIQNEFIQNDMITIILYIVSTIGGMAFYYKDLKYLLEGTNIPTSRIFLYYFIIFSFMSLYLWSIRAKFFRKLYRMIKRYEREDIILTKEGILLSPFIVLYDPEQGNKEFTERKQTFIPWENFKFLKIPNLNHNRRQRHTYTYRFVKNNLDEIVVNRSVFLAQEKEFIDLFAKYGKIILEDKIRNSTEAMAFASKGVIFTIIILIAVFVLLG